MASALRENHHRRVKNKSHSGSFRGFRLRMISSTSAAKSGSRTGQSDAVRNRRARRARGADDRKRLRIALDHNLDPCLNRLQEGGQVARSVRSITWIIT